MSILSTVVLSFLTFFSLAAGQTTNNASAVFVYDSQEGDGGQLVFALTANSNTGDLYFHLTSPAGNAWVGVGIGTQMQDALMFIAYPGSNEKNVTISPRLGTGHVEPSYQSDIEVSPWTGNGLQNANTVSGERENMIINADAICRGCGTWKSGSKSESIDFKSTTQPFIFAVGSFFPPLASDSKSANLAMHQGVGHFTMDMTKATITEGDGGSVPVGPYTAKAASAATGTQATSDPAGHIHGLVMCFTFVILIPFSSLVLRVWNKVKGHLIVNSIALVLFCMAFAGGVVTSTKYNKSKNFNSAHQIIGILILMAILSQWVLGYLNHRVFKKENRTTIMGKVHRYLGPALLLFALINAYVGFAFSGNGFLSIPYSVILFIVAIIYACIRGGTWWRRRRGYGAKESGPEGYQYPQFGHQPPPPQYGEANANGAYPPPYGQDVPLATYHSHSSQSIPQVGMPATQPRTMV